MAVTLGDALRIRQAKLNRKGSESTDDLRALFEKRTEDEIATEDLINRLPKMLENAVDEGHSELEILTLVEDIHFDLRIFRGRNAVASAISKHGCWRGKVIGAAKILATWLTVQNVLFKFDIIQEFESLDGPKSYSLKLVVLLDQRAIS